MSTNATSGSTSNKAADMTCQTALDDATTGDINTTATAITPSVLRTALRYLFIYILSICAIHFGYSILHILAQIAFVPLWMIVRRPCSEDDVPDVFTGCNTLVVIFVACIVCALRRLRLDWWEDAPYVYLATVAMLISLLAVAGIVGQILSIRG